METNSFTRSQPHGTRSKAGIDSQALAAAAANVVAVQVTNPAPAAANSGSVVPAQNFTPRVSGNVLVVANVDGVCISPLDVLQFTITIGAQTFVLTACAGANGDNSLSARLSHVFTGLTVGTQVSVAFTWANVANVDNFAIRNGQGSLLIQELPN